MATIIVRKSGFVIQFYLNRKRRSICLSQRYARKDVEEIARFVDKLKNAVELETLPDKKTLAWLESVPSELKVKFAKTELVILTRSKTLGEIVDFYLASSEFRSLKPKTRFCKEQGIKRFFSFFQPSRNVENLSRSDAQDFFEYLTGKYAQATRAGTIRDIKRVFNYAVENNFIEKSPFTNVKVGSYSNKEREVYIDMETFDKMLDACSSQELRTLLTLYRIGGLRLAEGLAVRREDVDLEKNALTVRSSKTEKFKGKDKRVIPLYPRLRDELVALLATTNQDALFTVNYYTLRKLVVRIIEKAGIQRYPRLIQNLRSSRAIEIYRDFGALAEREWIGHTENTAMNHYLHLLDADFKKATEN